MFNKIFKRFIASFLLVSTIITSYATDIDTIFGIRAYASSAQQKATSMLEFYKNGAELDRSKVSDVELYVFGVFVSNFFMPFQTSMGTMSSDAFVSQMAAMFFGDAYTAQQFSDMKYTLGLVQSAQSNRARIVNCLDNSPVSWQILLQNFSGFYSVTQSGAVDDEGRTAPTCYYTYEGSPRQSLGVPTLKTGESYPDLSGIVWQSNTGIFDAVIGQIISVCPTQAGYYAGTPGNVTSNLYIDPFGNISDSNNVLIVPACMNPYTFYNHYLSNDRKILSQPAYECPLQLPINNAFWMGTMVDPRTLTRPVEIDGKSIVIDEPAPEASINTDEEEIGAGDFKVKSTNTANMAASAASMYTTTSVTDAHGVTTVTVTSQLYSSGAGAEEACGETEETENEEETEEEEEDTGAEEAEEEEEEEEKEDNPTKPDTNIKYTALRKVLVSLPNLYSCIDDWTGSTTALIGIDTYDGSELGIYFSSDICTKYEKAFRIAAGYTDMNSPTSADLCDVTKFNEYGYIDPWKFMGGTAVPISFVLDDIALFDTYNNFSDSLSDSISVMSMYRDTSTDTWWASNSITGSSSKSILNEWLEAADDIFARTIYADNCTWEEEKAMGNIIYKAIFTGTRGFDSYGNPNKNFGEAGSFYEYNHAGALATFIHQVCQGYLECDELSDLIDALNKVVNLKGETDIAKIQKDYDEIITKIGANTDGYTITYDKLVSLFNYRTPMLCSESHASGSSWGEYATDMRTTVMGTAFGKSVAWNPSLDNDWKADDNGNIGYTVNDNVAIRDWKAFGWRTYLALVTGDPAFLTMTRTDSGGSDNAANAHGCIFAMFPVYYTETDGATGIRTTKLSTNVNTNTTGNGNANKGVIGAPIYRKGYTVAWNQGSAYVNHYFLQKAHPAAATSTKVSGWAASIYNFVVGIAAVVLIIAVVVLTVAIVIVTTAATGGAAGAAWAAIIVKASIAVIASATVLSVAQATKLKMDMEASIQDALLKSQLEHAYSVTYGMDAIAIASTVYSLDQTTYANYDPSQPMLINMLNAYNSKDVPLEKLLDDDGKDGDLGANMAMGAANLYCFYYTLYGPYKSLAPSLGAVSRVYDGQAYITGLESATELTAGSYSVSKKTGSYITNDVNMWGGIYYAYMYDILALTIDSKNKMTAAKLETNFPQISSKLTNKDIISFEGLLGQGTEEDKQAKEDENRRAMLERLMELTDINTSDYRNKLLTKTTNSWIVSTHASIVNSDSSGSIASIGSGSQYTGYSGYITTSTLSEMPFTSVVVDYYDIVYAGFMILVIVMGIFLLLMGHRSIRGVIFSVLVMGVVLLIPRVTVDTGVNFANNLAGTLYKDRFNFWAYAQHQQLHSQLATAKANEDKNGYLVITNMQQAKDYYSSENGVTLKWMSPKKESYWDLLANVTGGDEGGLNLSIFTWLFQGQFRQEIYSTDPLATYLYRPYNDIVQTIEAWSDKNFSRTDAWVSTAVVFPDNTDESGYSSDIRRLKYACYTADAWNAYYRNASIDPDIRVSHQDITGGSAYTLIPSDISGSASPGSVSLMTSGVPRYAVGMINSAVNNVSYNSAYYKEKNDDDYLEAYPCAYNSATTTASAGLQDAAAYDSEDEGGSTLAPADLKLFYLYSESPYYYFYNAFKDSAERYSDGSAKKLLLSESFYKYKGGNAAAAVSGKAEVTPDTMIDFMNLEELFTFVIPYLQQSNYYVDEWTDLWGMTITASNKDEDKNFKDNLSGIWKMYSPWVDTIYSAPYVCGKIRVAGKNQDIDDCINPGYYQEYRSMVFSPADMQRNYLTEADLSEVEKKIMQVLENTYVDFMYLNNYYNFDDEVLLSAMAMTATFNFNKTFSNTSFLGEDTLLYPVSYEIRNFSYDAFLRLALLNTTGESVFAETDIYTTVIENTNIVTGILMLLNDIVAVYLVPAAKLLLLLGLFFLGVVLCVACFFNPPEHMFKHLAKHYLAPFGIFFGVLIAHMCIVALFVGEGVTSIVGARGVTITTGDPTITILLLLLVNCLFIFGMWQVGKLLLSSFKISLNSVALAVSGLVGGVLATGLSAVKVAFRGGKKVVRGASRVAQKTTSAVTKAASLPIKTTMESRNRRRTAEMNAKALEDEREKRLKARGDEDKHTKGTDTRTAEPAPASKPTSPEPSPSGGSGGASKKNSEGKHTTGTNANASSPDAGAPVKKHKFTPEEQYDKDIKRTQERIDKANANAADKYFGTNDKARELNDAFKDSAATFDNAMADAQNRVSMGEKTFFTSMNEADTWAAGEAERNVAYEAAKRTAELEKMHASLHTARERGRTEEGQREAAIEQTEANLKHASDSYGNFEANGLDMLRKGIQGDIDKVNGQIMHFDTTYQQAEYTAKMAELEISTLRSKMQQGVPDSAKAEITARLDAVTQSYQMSKARMDQALSEKTKAQAELASLQTDAERRIAAQYESILKEGTERVNQLIGKGGALPNGANALPNTNTNLPEHNTTPSLDASSLGSSSTINGSLLYNLQHNSKAPEAGTPASVSTLSPINHKNANA